MTVICGDHTYVLERNGRDTLRLARIGPRGGRTTIVHLSCASAHLLASHLRSPQGVGTLLRLDPFREMFVNDADGVVMLGVLRCNQGLWQHVTGSRAQLHALADLLETA